VTTTPTPTINTFVVYAANNVTLGTGDHSVGGNIGVATSKGTGPEPSPQITPRSSRRNSCSRRTSPYAVMSRSRRSSRMFGMAMYQ